MLIAATEDRRVTIAAVICGALVAGALLAACGSSASTTGLSKAEAGRLDAHIRAIRDAAASHDQANARAQLDDLLGDVSALRRAGRLSSAQARALAIDVERVRATLDAYAPAADPPPDPGQTSRAAQSSTTSETSQTLNAPAAPQPPAPQYGGDGYGPPSWRDRHWRGYVPPGAGYYDGYRP